MQSLTVPTGAHNPNGHGAAAVLAALRAETGSRRLSFRYDLLTSANAYVQALTSVVSCSVTQNWLAEIKRTARFSITDTGEINYLQDRIRPWVRLHLPPYGDDDWVEWSQGVFLLSSPSRQDDGAGVITRDVEAYDQLREFADDLVSERYTVATSTVYTSAISTLLGSIDKNITVSASTIPEALEWEPGTSKLKIINELLGAINYNSLHFDENGTAIVSPYSTPANRAEEYTYADNAQSVMFVGVEQALDLFSIPNSWTIAVTEPDRPVLSSTYTNSDPASPTSTVSRQRTITDFRTEQEAADQATLDAKVERLAFEASQVFEKVEFRTAIMPIHSGNDVFRVKYSPLAIDAKYSEHEWTMDFEAGSVMRHKIRRVVTV
jgi:hypothetical protein